MGAAEMVFWLALVAATPVLLLVGLNRLLAAMRDDELVEAVLEEEDTDVGEVRREAFESMVPAGEPNWEQLPFDREDLVTCEACGAYNFAGASNCRECFEPLDEG